MSKEKQIDIIRDLLIEFDEMGFIPTTTVPDPEAYAIKWRAEITKALEDYRRQSEGIANNATTTGEWIEIPIDNYDGDPSGLYYVCSVCHTDNGFEDKPYCPNCGAKMKQN